MNITVDEIRGRIKKIIVSSLDLDIDPSAIGDDTLLFAPSLVQGMDLDSLAAIDIVVGMSNDFDLILDEVPKESFQSVATLSEFIAEKLAIQSAS